MKRCVAILPLGLLVSLVLLGCDPPPQAAPGPPRRMFRPRRRHRHRRRDRSRPAPAVNVPPAAPPGPPPLPVETKVGVFAGGLDDLAAPG